MGKLLKGVVKFTVATAAVGGICYIFKDKIKESKIYQDYDMDTKIQKVKTTIKEKMPNVFENEEDFVDEDEIFFDDLDLTAEDVERDYVSIDPETESTSNNTATKSYEKEKEDDSSSDVPTIEL